MRPRTRWPAILAFLVLSFQLAIPWSVKHLITQDGPSHLYTATVTSDLIFHRHTSPYHPFYRVQKLLPNWTATLVMAIASAIAGPDHAERIIMSLCLLAGFFGFHYALQVLAPGQKLITPVACLIFQSWFLWSGFYNFYLAMALLPFVVGYYLHKSANFTVRNAAILSAGLLAISVTHLVPTLLAFMTLFTLAAWRQIFPENRRPWSAIVLLAASALPALILIGMFAARSKEKLEFKPDLLNAFNNFPELIFTVARGRAGEQSLLWPALLFFVVIAALTLTRIEWRGPSGGLAIAALFCLALYFLIPDSGFGGSAVKMRFAWCFFLLGSLVACSAERMRPLLPAVALYVTIFLVFHLNAVRALAVQTSIATESYLSVADSIPPGARFLRMQYPIPQSAALFGTGLYTIDILLHLDALAAARNHAVDLSDYQAATGTFTADYKDNIINESQRGILWSMNDPGLDGGKNLAWLRTGLPLDYLLLVGDEVPSDTDFPRVLAEAKDKATLLQENSFVRLYKLPPAH